MKVKVSEVEFKAIKAQGAGGQHVNTSSTAIHLRFDIWASSLSTTIKQKLSELDGERISKNGVIVIKSQAQRSQLRNKIRALDRLHELIAAVQQPVKQRIPSKPSRSAKLARMADKKLL
ncbi:MAG: ribosome-associated protein, partial [Saprospiraceae bacterium]